MKYQDTISEKRANAVAQNKELQEIAAMKRELQKMQMAALMGSQGKSTVILTDQTDLGDKLKDMVDSFKATVESVDTTELNGEQVKELKALKSGLDELTKAVRASRPDNSDIIKAIKALAIAPVVNVPAPVVNVPAPRIPAPQPASKLDLTPLQDTLQELLQPKEAMIDLSCYRAQDIKESGDVQYVGFVNPEGHWYIIENDMKKNQMRYLFGKSGYSKYFKNAASYVYKLMDKAIHDAA